MKAWKIWLALAFIASTYSFFTIRLFYWLDGNVTSALGTSLVFGWLVFTACLAMTTFLYVEEEILT